MNLSRFGILRQTTNWKTAQVEVLAAYIKQTHQRDVVYNASLTCHGIDQPDAAEGETRYRRGIETSFEKVLKE